ncbi:MAG TPA: hypothetical protein VF152_14795 [Acidimicrobiia bacterium]
MFSQFTSHLALVREELDRAGITWLYLDGGTPAAEALGLAPSDGPPGVVGVPADPASPAPAPPDASGGTVAESWPKVKPHLDPR